MSLLGRRQKGRFIELPVCSQFTMTASAAKASVPGGTAHKHYPYPPWKQLFRPYTLGFISLAIIVALWGFGYKLSLYHLHDHPSARVSVAKMWIEPRNATAVPASKLKSRSHLFPPSQALSLPVQRGPNLKRAVACILRPSTRYIVYLNHLIPSRSPPSLRFCLA